MKIASGLKSAHRVVVHAAVVAAGGIVKRFERRCVGAATGEEAECAECLEIEDASAGESALNLVERDRLAGGGAGVSIGRCFVKAASAELDLRFA